MHYMNQENVVTSIVESMLPLFSGPKLGLSMILDIRASYKDKDASRLLQLIFVRPSNYTKVFTRQFDWEDLHGDEFMLQSDHDSCWRSDGLDEIFKLVSECCNEVAPDEPFHEANPRIGFLTFGGSPRYVRVDRAEGNPIQKERLIISEKERYYKLPIKLKLEKIDLKTAASLMEDNNGR